MLHVDLLIAVARPGERQLREVPSRTHGHQFFLIKEIVVAALVTEEQPIATWRLGCLPLVQERAERGDAGSWSDHDDRLRWILRQREMLGLLDIHSDLVAGRDAAAEEGRADAEARAVVDLVTHRIDRERDAPRIAPMR